MGDREAKAIEQVITHAQRLRIPLKALAKGIKTVTVNNPVGFDFTCEKGKTRDLLLSIIDSGKFGYDDPSTLFGFLAGCIAKRSGFKSSFREIGIGPSMHIQIGDSTCNAHIDSTGIAPARDSKSNNIYDFSKIVEHWDRDLRPELGPFRHFDVTVLRGPSEVTGGSQFGLVLSLRKKF
jgi:hypothetical protein